MDIYGQQSFDEFLPELQAEFPDFSISYYQSNVEGEIINKLHEASGKFHGIVLNAGGYTHTSVALADAVKAIDTPVVEVHISNIFAREDYRHISLVAPNSAGTVTGFGLRSYALALYGFRKMPKDQGR
jgi:3-dehydroquinate dehydratase-2